MTIEADNDDKNSDDNNGDDGHADVGEEEEEGDANDASDDPDAYNCALEKFGQNTIDDADENNDVKEEINAKRVAPTIIVEEW